MSPRRCTTAVDKINRAIDSTLSETLVMLFGWNGTWFLSWDKKRWTASKRVRRKSKVKRAYFEKYSS